MTVPAPPDVLKRTPLYDVHVALGARMVPFAGYEMPLQYSGIIQEHRAVREVAGLFDVSHMGEFVVRGEQAADFVQRAITNDVRTLYPGRALYTVMCNERGGTIDDLIVYMLDEDAFMLVVNAANIEKDFEHLLSLQQQWDYDCSLEDRSDLTALIALQGPQSLDLAARVADLGFDKLKNYHFLIPEPGTFLGAQNAIVSRTGYTGEIGLEIYCEPERAEAVWQALIGVGRDTGLLPCGLGARDTLRLEAGYALYGHELTETMSPLEAGLAWVVKLDKTEFVGREALLKQKQAGVDRRLVAFLMEPRAIPRAGNAILGPDGEEIGEVTSGSQSPVLGRGIGLGIVRDVPEATDPGSPLCVMIRGKSVSATVSKPPFHKIST